MTMVELTDAHTAESCLLRRGLAGSRWVRLGTRRCDLAALAALDFVPEGSRLLLDLAEAVLEGVVGCAEVHGGLLQVHLSMISMDVDSNAKSNAHLDTSSKDGGDDTLPGGLRVPVDLAVGHNLVNVDGDEGKWGKLWFSLLAVESCGKGCERLL